MLEVLQFYPIQNNVQIHPLRGEGELRYIIANTTEKISKRDITIKYAFQGSWKIDSVVVKERMRDHALFIAFAPADHPKIAIAVLVENGGFGAQAAAPIARQVFDYYLLGKLPNAPAPTDDSADEEEDAPDEPPPNPLPEDKVIAR